jgi:hypothetical protein
VVAASLDGYIAGPKGEYDWIIIDPEIDFNALFDQFDTAVLGSNSLQSMEDMGETLPAHLKAFVFYSSAITRVSRLWRRTQQRR